MNFVELQLIGDRSSFVLSFTEMYANDDMIEFTLGNGSKRSITLSSLLKFELIT